MSGDATSIYSTDSTKIFRYGYPFTKKECEEILPPYIRDYDFKKGEVIGDIGAASGWLDAAFSVLTDSVTFYVEDIDTNFLSPTQFNKVIQYFNGVREKPQTNTFHFVLGTSTKTKLPDGLFDKIIFNNSFHEINSTLPILGDVNKKLKSGGKIMIRERFSNVEKDYFNPGCSIPCLEVPKVEELLLLKDFYLTDMTDPYCSMTNHLTFEKDEAKAKRWKDKIKAVDYITKQLCKLSNKRIAKDFVKVKEIGLFLKEHEKEYSNVFINPLQQYLDALGYDYLMNEKVEEAIHIFNINVLIYPTSANVYDALGEALMEDKKYNAALLNYTKSYELDSKNENAKAQMEVLRALITANGGWKD
jgi:tetratricopeptide (TPR) repeat protein